MLWLISATSRNILVIMVIQSSISPLNFLLFLQPSFFYVFTVLIGPKKCHLERSRHRIVFLFCQSAAAAAESDSIGMHNERSLDNVVLVI